MKNFIRKSANFVKNGIRKTKAPMHNKKVVSCFKCTKLLF